MARLLGDRLLPDTVVERRGQFRARVRDLRQPLRQFRERNVPGPDLIGSAENNLTDLRNRVVSRNSVLSRIQARRGSSDDGDNSGNGDSGSKNVNDSALT